MHYKTVVCLLVGFISLDYALSNKINCVSPGGAQRRGVPIALTCASSSAFYGIVNLEFNVPESLKIYSKISDANTTSRTIMLTLPDFLDYNRAISCRLNKLRFEVCSFQLKFEPNNKVLNKTQSEKKLNSFVVVTKRKDTGIIIFVLIYMSFLLFLFVFLFLTMN
jgi:hypothetical protein